MHRLDNPVRAYAWGSKTQIARFLQREPSDGPEAELWIGAHPDSPSTAFMPDGTSGPLDELVRRDPEAVLGRPAVRRFGPVLPFLAKVLAAEQALSLQVHPTLAQAAQGFSAEQLAGVPGSSPQRNFKDPNHKPEMIVALSRFEALCGFRRPTEAAALFRELQLRSDQAGQPVPEAIPTVLGLLGHPCPEEALRHAFAYLLRGGRAIADAVEAIRRLLEAGPLPADPALATVADLGRAYPGDPGVLISLLLNHVILEPGQALFLAAGNIHAYLRGLGFEVMAASDNVLRGGLTAKHVDIQLLLETVVFSPLPVPLLIHETTSRATRRWRPPVEEFQLEHVAIPPGDPDPVRLAQNGPVIVVVVEGTARVAAAGDARVLRGGEALLIPAAESPATIAAEPGEEAPARVSAFAVTVGQLIP